jgi:PAS domain S-box-containing protein
MLWTVPANLSNSGEQILAETKLSHCEWNNQPAIFGISKDLTRQIMAEHTLEVSEKKYKTMLNASPDGMLVIDLDCKITEVSEIGLQLFGDEARDGMIGRQITAFVPPVEQNIISGMIEKIINEGLTQNLEVIIRKENPTFFAGELSATLIQGADGEPLSFMIIVRDISQRKKAEAKQMHADRMANLGEMASGIAHEINQPLNIISMVLDNILIDTSRNQKIDVGFLKEISERIFENITRIRNIIDHIRAFSRSYDDYVFSGFNVNTAIENAVSMITEQFKYLVINVKLDLDKEVPEIFGNTY